MRGSTRTSRIAAYVTSATLALSGTVLAATPAEAVTYDPQPANQAASWLEDQLTNGVVHNNQYDFDDLGLTADFALGLAGVPGQDELVTDVVETIEPRAESEWYTSTFEGEVTTYAGSLAKALVLAQEVGSDPTSFGGENLVTKLQNRTAGSAPIAGRIQNLNDDFGDANVIGQAYAVNGLTAAGSSEAKAATNFLLKQQCSNGGFRLNFTTSKTTSAQSCTNNSSAETDVTAIAILQLASQAGTSTVDAAVTRATAWLKSQQRCDGSFGGGTSTEGSNANSTGLVAWALGASPTARQAAGWLRKHQATAADSGNSLASETGAIAYDDLGLANGRADGITVGKEDEWRRATAQAAPGIRWVSTDATPVLSATGPGDYRKAGDAYPVSTTGAAKGTVLCLTGPGASRRVVASGAPWNTTVKLPAGTADRTYTVEDPFGNTDTVVAKVLGRKTLEVSTNKSLARRSRLVTVTIEGLAPREAARIFYKGKQRSSGAASSAGTFSATFYVGTTLGTQQIAGYGKFGSIRQGATTIRVIR